jgi:hypothetical protein
LSRRWLLRYYALITRLSGPLVAAPLAAPDAVAAHGLSARERRRLVRRMRTTTTRVPAASHYLEHLTMAARLLSVPSDLSGCVVECGSWRGASATNLSIACQLAGRRLQVFDSFAGLPSPQATDSAHQLMDRPEVHTYRSGMFAGALEEVRANVERYGEIGCCTFHPGLFADTLPGFDEPVVLAFLDVDLRESLETCVRALWPRLRDGGTLFIHEAPHHEIASFFFDERWWRENLACAPPGLVGAGCGIGLLPLDGFWRSALGFTRKNLPVDEFYTRPPVDVV